MVKSAMTETVPSWGRGGTAAAMAQNEQTTEEHSTLEQQSPGRFDHPAWCGRWTSSVMTIACRLGLGSMVAIFAASIPDACSPKPLCDHCIDGSVGRLLIFWVVMNSSWAHTTKTNQSKICYYIYKQWKPGCFLVKISLSELLIQYKSYA